MPSEIVERRLFQGCVSMRVESPGKSDIHNEMYVDWAPSKDAATGAFVTHAMAKHPKGLVAWQSVNDITDIARMSPTTEDEGNG